MNEKTLLNYFQNTVSVEELSEDLKGSQKKTGYDTTAVYVSTIEKEKEFEIKKEHLLKLSNDFLLDKLTPIDINTIAFSLNTSDYFYWNEETPEGNIVDIVIFAWDNPEISHPLTRENFQLWKEYLQTGNYKLAKL